METLISKFIISGLMLLMPTDVSTQDFQGKAYYSSKSTLDLGRWGARLSAAQKKQVQARLKNRLEKTYVLTFTLEESMFKEEDKLDAISGATDSWGKNFAQGDQYKNVKTNTLLQDQEFYGKRFLVKDKLQKIEWDMTAETKQIGNYTCFKATASVPTSELLWYSFSWDRLRRPQANNDENNEEGTNESAEKLTQIEAWYTPQIPVGHGPSEYWGLPGLILEVSAGTTTMLCTKIVMNPKEKAKIKAPERGKEITKKEYQETLIKKMTEMREMYRGRRSRRS
ncbi:MAG: GLPGLI family protein [Flavobacteriaceae bacterium]|nr:GLPGLI family protein [Flavobacteriaceae bacterium]